MQVIDIPGVSQCETYRADQSNAYTATRSNSSAPHRTLRGSDRCNVENGYGAYRINIEVFDEGIQRSPYERNVICCLLGRRIFVNFLNIGQNCLSLLLDGLKGSSDSRAI